MKEYLRWRDKLPLWSDIPRMPLDFAQGFEYLCRRWGEKPHEVLAYERKQWTDPSPEHAALERMQDDERTQITGVDPHGHRLF